MEGESSPGRRSQNDPSPVHENDTQQVTIASADGENVGDTVKRLGAGTLVNTHTKSERGHNGSKEYHFHDEDKSRRAVSQLSSIKKANETILNMRLRAPPPRTIKSPVSCPLHCSRIVVMKTYIPTRSVSPIIGG